MKKNVPPEAVSPGLRRYEVLIFLTGAVTLALEVLASRIMTPYFGVSLYIWAGILSITLIFLALGYHLGGRISRGRENDALMRLMLAAPLAAALAIVLATVLYPAIFPRLATLNLVLASFLGGTLLLSLPLVVLSAMNPLLIALGREVRAGGDAGAGRVFFVSTVGSVAGVVFTAFLVIPHLSNFRALLWLSLGLGGAVALLTALSREIPRSARKLLLSGCVLVMLLAAGLLAGQRAYFRLLAGMSDIGGNFDLLAEYTSVFGNIKVVEVRPDNPQRQPARAYLQDGIIQNLVTADGVVLDHTGFICRLISLYAPTGPDSLVLGMAAGMIPRYLAQQGHKVTAVEINPNSLDAATEFFGFNPREVDFHLEDARTFVRRHPNAYDLVVADLFQGDCTPDYLLTREFFGEVRASLKPQGVVIINTWFDPANERVNDTILATVAAAFPHVLEFRSPSSQGLISSVCLVAAKVPLSPEPALELAGRQALPPKDYATLKAARVVPRESLAGVLPVSDDRNIFSILFAGSQLRYRRQLNQLPPHLLVN